MSLFWLFGLCLFGWLFGAYGNSYGFFHKIGFCIRCRCGMKENILNFLIFRCTAVLGRHETSYAISRKIQVVSVVLYGNGK